MSDRPPLSDFDLSGVSRPDDGVLYLYRSFVDDFWYVDNDPEMALQEATGQPVGELLEIEEKLGETEEQEQGELLAIYLPWASEYDDPMYCSECDRMVRENFDRFADDWKCPSCGSTPLYEDKEEYIEIVHATARFNKENGYGPWWDSNREARTDDGYSVGGTEWTEVHCLGCGDLLGSTTSPNSNLKEIGTVGQENRLHASVRSPMASIAVVVELLCPDCSVDTGEEQ